MDSTFHDSFSPQVDSFHVSPIKCHTRQMAIIIKYLQSASRALDPNDTILVKRLRPDHQPLCSVLASQSFLFSPLYIVSIELSQQNTVAASGFHMALWRFISISQWSPRTSHEIGETLNPWLMVGTHLDLRLTVSNASDLHKAYGVDLQVSPHCFWWSFPARPYSVPGIHWLNMDTRAYGRTRYISFSGSSLPIWTSRWSGKVATFRTAGR